MTSQDFSFEFDILYNNVSSNQAPGLTEYEKSVFLTQAQEALVLDLYKGITGDSFETTEEVTRYLSSLVTTHEFDGLATTYDNTLGIKRYNAILTDVENLWFITYQAGSISVNDNNRDVIVVPTRQDSLFKDLNNPFKGPNKNRVLSTSEENSIILYSKYPINTFYIKYLKKPNPIVLDNSDTSVNDVYDFQIDLPESLHRQILLRAVQLAKAVWQS